MKNTGFNEYATFRKCDESFMNESIHGSESNVDVNSLPKGMFPLHILQLFS